MVFYLCIVFVIVYLFLGFFSLYLFIYLFIFSLIVGVILVWRGFVGLILWVEVLSNFEEVVRYGGFWGLSFMIIYDFCLIFFGILLNCSWLVFLWFVLIMLWIFELKFCFVRFVNFVVMFLSIGGGFLLVVLGVIGILLCFYDFELFVCVCLCFVSWFWI